jgi:hypothetical protein
LGIERNQGYHLLDGLQNTMGYSNIYYDESSIKTNKTNNNPTKKQGIFVGGYNRSIIIDEIT